MCCTYFYMNMLISARKSEFQLWLLFLEFIVTVFLGFMHNVCPLIKVWTGKVCFSKFSTAVSGVYQGISAVSFFSLERDGWKHTAADLVCQNWIGNVMHGLYAHLMFCRVQELMSDDQREAGRIPRTIECELVQDLVDSCVPGDMVTITGIVKVLSTEEGKIHHPRTPFFLGWEFF